jgi:uncharacterized membrane-anchored protein YhcB (DUF1043 family)
VTLPGLAVVFGLLFAGQRGAIVGFGTGILLGTFGLYVGRDDDARIEELERELAETRRELEELRAELDDRR